MADESKIPYKQRELKGNQEFTKSCNGIKIPLYSLDKIDNSDWELFMLLASLGKVESYIYLFIVIWDTIPVRNNTEFSREFDEETSDMIQIIEELNISRMNDTNYAELLDEYGNYRYYNQDLSQRIVHNSWVELESCGFKRCSHAFEDQLKRCTIPQKKDLRLMILSRMKLIQKAGKNIKVKNLGDDERDMKSLIKENENLKSQVTDLVADHELLLEENENLKSQVATLVEENFQKAVPSNPRNSTIVSLNDDVNNEKKLISDIKELQDMLDDFTMVQGSGYKIKDQNVASLLETYKCKPKYPSTKASFVIGTVLQHRAITTILEDARQYFQYARSSGNIDPTLESDIVDTTENLIRYTELFRDKRGKDDITKITPIKIRQHTYSALSSRGLSSKHPLIKESADNLLNEMNKFREVVDKETRNELHNQAIQISYKVINIFCFRLKAQSSEPGYRFFQAGDDLDARLMQGSFGEQEVKNLEVEACGFPCIAIFGDKSNPRVFKKAKIIASPKKYVVYSMNK